jgi:glyoxylate/hydroxypyruvate reductase A
MNQPRRLAIVHHRAPEWAAALQAAEPRLDIRAWHPKEIGGTVAQPDMDWLLDAEALFTWRFPDGFFAMMPKLKWVQNAGAGVDHLLGHPELPGDVLVTRADGRFGLWMARYVCGYLLYEAQEIDACHRAQAARQWQGRLLPERLHDKNALIVGFGRIGRSIGIALRALGMAVHGFATQDRQDPDFPVYAVGRLPEYIQDARALVLCAPATEATRGMINAATFEKGHPCLTLVNVGRGSQVVLPDMLDALDNGRLGRAVLDVFPEEPLKPEDPLWSHPRVTITPHHSGPTVPEDLISDILPNIRAYAEGRPIMNAVERGKGY